MIMARAAGTAATATVQAKGGAQITWATIQSKAPSAHRPRHAQAAAGDLPWTLTLSLDVT
jgi:hypothetical protein